MRPYAPDPDDVSAVFPGAIYSPQDIFDFGDPVAFTEPVGTVAQARYELTFLPARFPVPEITIDGNPRTVVSYNPEAPPGIGQVAVGFDFPIIEFHEDDIDLEWGVTYHRIMSVYTARLMNQLQKELAAAQAYARGISPSYSCMIDGTPDERAVLPGNGVMLISSPADSVTVKRVWVSANDVTSATDITDFVVTTNATPTITDEVDGVEVNELESLGSGESTYRTARDVNWVIDTSGGPVWLNVFCTVAGGHQNITVGVDLG